MPFTPTLQRNSSIACWEFSIPFLWKSIMTSFKTDGLKRVVIATSALSMGVNFPNVWYVVMFGPARSLLDFHQQAGWAVRNGLPSDVVLYFYGQQLAHCEKDVHNFLKATGCHCVASYLSFDPDIPLFPSHDCCSLCTTVCLCNDRCPQPNKPFEKGTSVQTLVPMHHRSVSDEERNVLKGAQSEVETSISHRVWSSVFGSTSFHGFSQELISDVVANSHKLFTTEDITTHVPVSSANVS